MLRDSVDTYHNTFKVNNWNVGFNVIRIHSSYIFDKHPAHLLSMFDDDSLILERMASSGWFWLCLVLNVNDNLLWQTQLCTTHVSIDIKLWLN